MEDFREDSSPSLCFGKRLCALSRGNVSRPRLGSLHDFELKFPEFGQILMRYFVKNRIAFTRQVNLDEAAILLALDLSHQPTFFRALYQSHHGVVAALQKLSQFGNCGPPAACIASHAQHKLMLLRGNSTRPGYALTEAKEATDAVAEPCQPAQRFRSRRRYFRGWRRLFHNKELYHNVIYFARKGN